MAKMEKSSHYSTTSKESRHEAVSVTSKADHPRERSSNTPDSLLAKPPSSVQEAQAMIAKQAFDNTTSKSILKALKIVGAQNSRRATKHTIISHKMVQRCVSIQEIQRSLLRNSEFDGVEAQRLYRLPSTTVRIMRKQTGREEIECVRGDVPILNDGLVSIALPSLTATDTCTLSEGEGRPSFEANEYCRLLHVFGDSRMTGTRQRLMQCMTRAELDQQHEDPWSTPIAPLFNDINFKPEPNRVLSGGVTLDDIRTIDPAECPFARDGGVLKRKFGEFKNLYGTCVSRYEASGQGDPDAFALFAESRSYIMYAYCYLQLNPLLQPLATRVLGTDAQREEGVGEGLSPYGFGGREISTQNTKRRRRNTKEIDLVGVDSLISALKSSAQDGGGRSNQAEQRKQSFEEIDALSRATRSTLQAMNEAKDMLGKASDEEEKKLFEGIVRKLMGHLARAEAAL